MQMTGKKNKTGYGSKFKLKPTRSVDTPDRSDSGRHNAWPQHISTSGFGPTSGMSSIASRQATYGRCAGAEWLGIRKSKTKWSDSNGKEMGMNMIVPGRSKSAIIPSNPARSAPHPLTRQI